MKMKKTMQQNKTLKSHQKKQKKKKKNVRHGNERANSGCYAHVLAGTVLEDAFLLDS
jgi:hypothetical protein